MKISDILCSRQVRTLHACNGKKHLFQFISELAQDSLQTPAATLAEALSDRETIGATAFGSGVALPHARIRGIDKIQGVFCRLDKPIDFCAVDNVPVDLIFAIFTPDNEKIAHLQALATVARTMRKNTLCTKLRANCQQAALYALLTDDLALAA